LAILERMFFRDCTYWTILYTLLAMGALIGHRSVENPETGENREKSPEGAEITTPEPLPDHSEGQEGNKKDEN